jgi:hypothetical protein
MHVAAAQSAADCWSQCHCRPKPCSKLNCFMLQMKAASYHAVLAHADQAIHERSSLKLQVPRAAAAAAVQLLPLSSAAWFDVCGRANCSVSRGRSWPGQLLYVDAASCSGCIAAPCGVGQSPHLSNRPLQHAFITHHHNQPISSPRHCCMQPLLPGTAIAAAAAASCTTMRCRRCCCCRRA